MCDICKEKEYEWVWENDYAMCCKECFEAELRLVQIDLMESCPSKNPSGALRPTKVEEEEFDPVPPMFR